MLLSKKMWIVIVHIAILLVLIVPNKSYAHSTLVDALPAPNIHKHRFFINGVNCDHRSCFHSSESNAVEQTLILEESSSKGDLQLHISPNTPGKNVFTLTSHGPTSSAPKYVHVYMKYLDDDTVSPIEVPFQPSSVNPAAFTAEGHYFPFPGKWHIEIRVMDTNDDEMVYDHTIKMFKSL
ncbi:hypothetical protein AB4114_30720 [Paenibacillus sp. 2RAB27]|uniref:hypothetical protein n=1 Tax=Paenibacillus sp. 2RAB27 TaxID=3232991 RepID=UPI003F9D01B2